VTQEPTQEELREARNRLEEQILRMKNPAYPRDRNPFLLARLEATLANLDAALEAGSKN